jgi:DNA polymerase
MLYKSRALRGANDPHTSASDFLPDDKSLDALRRAASTCRGCALYASATQTVFGEGAARATLMLVGEQPGNDEDLKGRPFVGPAGRLLDEALETAGIDRSKVYITNVVKHFKWVPRGKRRLHSKPGWREIDACLPWLQQELVQVRPALAVCLGATAAQALIGRDFKVTVRHGEVIANGSGPAMLATIHPSAILRQPTMDGRASALETMVADLKLAAEFLRQH